MFHLSDEEPKLELLFIKGTILPVIAIFEILKSRIYAVRVLIYVFNIEPPLIYVFNIEPPLIYVFNIVPPLIYVFNIVPPLILEFNIVPPLSVKSPFIIIFFLSL